MLPVTHGLEFTRLHILLYTCCVYVTLLPYLTGMSGITYLSGALALWRVLYFTVKLRGSE